MQKSFLRLPPMAARPQLLQSYQTEAAVMLMFNNSTSGHKLRFKTSGPRLVSSKDLMEMP